MRNKGIALLYSIIIVSIVLAISIGLSNIVATETFLSNTGRQSQMAIYAADAGIDCAIYWDTRPGQPLGTKSYFSTSTPAANVGSCAGDNITVGGYTSCVGGLLGTEPDSDCTGVGQKRAGRSTFTLDFDNKSCAIVTVYRIQDYTDPSFPVVKTFIHSDGFSSGGSHVGLNASCASTDSRHFQRSLETTSYGE